MVQKRQKNPWKIQQEKNRSQYENYWMLKETKLDVDKMEKGVVRRQDSTNP